MKEPSGTVPHGFTTDTAKKTGLSQSIIQKSIKLATALTPEVKEKVKELDLPMRESIKLARN